MFIFQIEPVPVPSAFKRMILVYRQMAKTNAEDRARCLREAWRIRSILKTGYVQYANLNGKSVPYVPNVPVGSLLSYI
jgi:hypothetical protein